MSPSRCPRVPIAVFRTAVLGLALGLTACSGSFRDHEFEAKLTLPDTVERLVVRIGGGTLSLLDAEDAETSVMSVQGTQRIAARDDEMLARVVDYDPEPKLTLSEDGKTATYQPATLPEGIREVEDVAVLTQLVLRVPPGLSVELRNRGRGQLGAEGRTGDVLMETQAGMLLAKNCSGHFQGSTAEGAVLVMEHKGSLNLRTADGTIRATVRELGPRGVMLETETKSLICELPNGVGFDLRAETGLSKNGKQGVIARRFDIAVEERRTRDESTGRERLGHIAEGSVNGGGPPVRLKVTRGHLSVTEIDR